MRKIAGAIFLGGVGWIFGIFLTAKMIMTANVPVSDGVAALAFILSLVGAAGGVLASTYLGSDTHEPD